MSSNENSSVTNGHIAPALAFPGGFHVPLLTFFTNDPQQEIDWEVQEKHTEFVISSGVDGILVAGTAGEATALTSVEKIQLAQKARKIAQRVGRAHVSIILGCSAGCTRDVIDRTVEAKAAGADAALVLVPSYFHFAMVPAAIVAFFEEVADASPIPIIIYSYPNVVAGLDVDSKMLDTLGRHRNIVGVKLTCGGIAKVATIAAALETKDFCALAGQSDWLVPALSVGATGCITGVANLFPKTCCEMYNLYQSGKTKEAAALQKQVAMAELGFAKSGINGSKWLVAKKLGYPETSADCRRPYPKYSSEEGRKWLLNQTSNLNPIERRL